MASEYGPGVLSFHLEQDVVDWRTMPPYSPTDEQQVIGAPPKI